MLMVETGEASFGIKGMFAARKSVEGLAKALARPQGGLLVLARGSASDAAAVETAEWRGASAVDSAERLALERPGSLGDERMLAPTVSSKADPTAPTVAGPDPSRGFDVEEYSRIWSALAQEKAWPSVHRFTVVGPVGDEFKRSAASTVTNTLGWDAESVTGELKSRWQSVRLDVRCATPDDFCALHSRLKSLPDVRFLL